MLLRNAFHPDLEFQPIEIRGFPCLLAIGVRSLAILRTPKKSPSFRLADALHQVMSDLRDLQRERADLASQRFDLIRALADKRRPHHAIDADERQLLAAERKLADVERRIAAAER